MGDQVMQAGLAAFPTAEVEAALDRWWQEERQDAALPGEGPGAPDIMTPAVEIDSHRAVRALLTLQDVVKFEIPETVFAKGGYDDFAAMRADLIPRIRAMFDERREKQDG